MSDKTYKLAMTRDMIQMAFDPRTPDDLCALLCSLNHTRARVVLVYGDVETGEMWESATPERGRIGRSTGTSKIPLLVRTSRSFGGEAVLDHCILQMRESQGGKVLYQRKGITLHHKEEKELPELPFTD